MRYALIAAGLALALCAPAVATAADAGSGPGAAVAQSLGGPSTATAPKAPHAAGDSAQHAGITNGAAAKPPSTITAPDPAKDPAAYASALWTAAKSGAWGGLAALVLLGLVAALKRWGKSLVGDVVHGKLAEERTLGIVELLLPFLGALGAGVWAGGWSWTAVAPGLATAWAGAHVWSSLRRIWSPAGGVAR